jgi:very-short-patch-repair endonuclease
MLRSLLHFADTGKLGAGTYDGDGYFDSPFEEAVARAIREAGYRVHSQVGVSSFRIDLGVIDRARPGQYILGVECDGATYHSARSARDRDRLRQEVLENLGWCLHRIWSTDWFRNPQRETDKLISAIRTAAESYRATPDVEDDTLEEQEDMDVLALPARCDKGDSSGAELSNVVDYQECPLAVPFRRSLLDLPIPEVARLSQMVVEAEGPVHCEEIARRIREAFGLQKTGSRILAHVNNSLGFLGRAGTLARDGEFWSVPGRSIPSIRNRRNASLPLRRATMVAPVEYRLAITTALDEAVALSRCEVAVETARLFGFDRTGPDLKHEIEKQVDVLIEERTIIDDGGRLRLP